MEWDEEAINQARRAVQAVNDATDEIALKAAQIVSLMSVLAEADGVPADHRSNVCHLAAGLAEAIIDAAFLLLQPARG